MMALNVVWQMVASKRFNYHEEGMKQLLHNQQGTIHILRNQYLEFLDPMPCSL